MKKIKTFFLLCILFSFTNTAIAQVFTQEILYTYTAKNDISSESRKSSLTILRISEHESYFSDYWQFKRQEVRSNTKLDTQEKIEKIKTLALPAFPYFIKKEKENLYLIQAFNNQNIGYSESLLQAKDWQILNETKKILDYNCTKAQTQLGGRIWTAWFTDEIPISDGPYKFSGLPGLILQIYDNENEHAFEITEIKNIREPLMDISFKEVSKSKYISLRDHEQLANIERLEKAGVLSGIMEDGVPVNVQKFKEDIKKEILNKNHIEKD